MLCMLGRCVRRTHRLKFGWARNLSWYTLTFLAHGRMLLLYHAASCSAFCFILDLYFDHYV